MATSEQRVRTGTVTGIDLVAYFTADPERSIAFYRDVLGMTPTEIDDGGRGAELPWRMVRRSAFGSPSTKGACVMLAVDDIGRALSEFRSRGAELSEPDETPVCHMAFGKDPDGNTLIVHQRKH